MQKQKFVIDAGSSNISIYGGGFLLREPNVAVIKRGNSIELIAVGNEALKMTALPEHCSLVNPVRDGVVVRPDVYAKILEYYLEKVVAKSFNPVELYVLIPSGLSGAERDSLEIAVQKTGYKDITLVESLFGLLPVLGDSNRVVALFGGGTTEIGVINGDGIITGCTVNISGNTVNEKIIEQVLKTYNLRITWSMAEKLKKGIGSLSDNDVSVMDATGQDLLDGRIKNVEISATSLRAPIAWCYKKIAELIESVLTTVPYAKLAEVSDNGLYIAGEGANTRGLVDFLTRYLKLPVHVIEEPETAVIKGAYDLIMNAETKYQNILGNKR
ncbi:MAG: rod shape-determining protein [Clostridia bacterium]|nr:rod shape-determining protein [Clostridia bacterium]